MTYLFFHNYSHENENRGSQKLLSVPLLPFKKILAISAIIFLSKLNSGTLKIYTKIEVMTIKIEVPNVYVKHTCNDYNNMIQS